MTLVKQFESETGSVSISRLESGELCVHDLKGDAMMFLKARRCLRMEFPGEEIIVVIRFDNEAMFSAVTAMGLSPDQIVFRGIP